MLNQIIATLLAKIYANVDGCKEVYQVNLPEGFVTPSIYVVPPTIRGELLMPSHYLDTITLMVRIYHTDQRKAYQAGMAVMLNLRSDRHTIRLNNEDGTPSDKYKFLKEVSGKPIGYIDENTQGFQLSMEWTMQQGYDIPDHTKIAEIFYNTIIE